MPKKTKKAGLEAVLDKGENSKTEFKANKSEGLDREITAFANSKGGKIYIGVTDEGRVKGLEITNRLKSQIEDIAKNCDPKIAVSLKELKKEKVLIVEVPESENKPHRCSSGFYIRSGASSQKLSRDEIWEFMRDEELFEFDAIPCKKFDFKKHFDKKKLFFFLDISEMEYNKRDYIQLLENLGAAKKQGSKIVFNNAGALFFSRDLDRMIPHAEISCALFKGTDKSHPIIDRKIFNNDIINNVEDALGFLKKHLRLEYHFPTGQLQREEVLEIPEEALREALVNAVTHRDYLKEGVSVTVEMYDDRVEIYNFGGLPKGLKRSEFGKKSAPRNKLIASLMLRAHYIEKMGTGIKKMRRLIKEAGLKPIKFEFDSFTTLTFYRKPLKSKAEERFEKTCKEYERIQAEYNAKRPEYNAECDKANAEYDKVLSKYNKEALDEKKAKLKRLALDKAEARCQKIENEWTEAKNKLDKAFYEVQKAWSDLKKQEDQEADLKQKDA